MLEKRKELVFDKEKFKIGNDHPYDVKYILFESKKEPWDIALKEAVELPHYSNKNDITVCFSTLRDKLVGDKLDGHNKVLYSCDIKYKGDEYALSSEEIERWVKLCQKHDMLPKINSNFHIDGEVCFDLSKVTPPTLNIWLCCVRHVQENPWYVRAVLHLITDLDIGFFTAVTAASYFCINNHGHHFIKANKYNACNKSITEIGEINLSPGRCLAMFLQKDRTKKTPVNDYFGLFDAFIKYGSSIPIKVKVEDLALTSTEEKLTKE